jgi:hypothetical protein
MLQHVNIIMRRLIMALHTILFPPVSDGIMRVFEIHAKPPVSFGLAD